jgi:hypothetical protein
LPGIHSNVGAGLFFCPGWGEETLGRRSRRTASGYHRAGAWTGRDHPEVMVESRIADPA